MPHQHHAGHQHHHAMDKRQNAGTVVQYVYKTAAKTFDGPIAGYSTINAPEPAATPQSNSGSSNSNSNSDNSGSQQQQQQAAQQSAAAASSAALAAEVAEASASAVSAASASMVAAAAVQATQQATTPSQTQIEQATTPTSIPSPTTQNTKVASKATPATTSPSETTPTLAAATSSSPLVTSSPSSMQSQAAVSSAPTHSAAATKSDSSGGMSGGAKAGLAIGLLLLAGLIIAGAFLCYRRRKRQTSEYAKTDDEKSAYAGGLARAQSTTSTRTTATAPRLSLRPVTQFLPDLAARGKAANAAGAAAAGGAAMATKEHNNPANPFGKHAEVSQPSETSSNEKSVLPIQANTNENPFADNAGIVPPSNERALPPSADVPAPLRVRTPTPETAAAAAGAGIAGAGAGAIAATKLNERNNVPKPLALSPNRSASPAPAAPSPVTSEFSQTSATPAAMANGPPPSNVHRIQLDFKPSMDDELALRAGQLVRLLHEYDDGWVSHHVPILAFLDMLILFIGSLHPSGPFATRCCSSYLSLSSSCQATSTPRCSRTGSTWPSPGNDGSRPTAAIFTSWRPWLTITI